MGRVNAQRLGGPQGRPVAGLQSFFLGCFFARRFKEAHLQPTENWMWWILKKRADQRSLSVERQLDLELLSSKCLRVILCNIGPSNEHPT